MLLGKKTWVSDETFPQQTNPLNPTIMSQFLMCLAVFGEVRRLSFFSNLVFSLWLMIFHVFMPVFDHKCYAFFCFPELLQNHVLVVESWKNQPFQGYFMGTSECKVVPIGARFGLAKLMNMTPTSLGFMVDIANYFSWGVYQPTPPPGLGASGNLISVISIRCTNYPHGIW